MAVVVTDTSMDRRLLRATLLALGVVGTVVLAVLVALSPQRSYLAVAAAIGLIVVVAALVEPVFGVYALVAAMFAENLLRLGLISTARLVVILTFAAWLAHGLSRKQLRLALPLPGWLAIAFAVWGLLSALWGISSQKLLGALQTLVQSIALYVLVVHLLSSFRRVQVVIAIVLVATLALSSLALVRLAAGDVVGGRVDITQVFGTGPHALAGYLLPGAIVLMAMLAREQQRIRKLLWLAALLATMLAVLATGTRAAEVALAAVVVVGIIVEWRMWQVALSAMLVLGLARIMLPAAALARIGSVLTTSDRGAGRLDIWLVALRIINAHPILGVGLDNFGQAFDRYLAGTPGLQGTYFVQGWGSHNMFVNVQAELGIVGLALFAATVSLSVRSGWVAVVQLKRAGDHSNETLALGIWLALLGTLALGLFLDWHYCKYLWLLLALAEVTRRLSVGDARVNEL